MRERESVCVYERERERERERMFANAVVVCLDEGKSWKSGTGKMAICWLLGFRVAARLMATARRWRLRVDGDCAKQGCWYQTDSSRKLRFNDSAVGRLALEHACFPLFLSYYFASPTFSLSNACM